MGQGKLMLYSLVLQPPFVQTLSPGHTADDLAMVTCEQMHHMHFCMGNLCISLTMHIQRGPHDHPPGFHALYAPTGVSPAFVPQWQPTLVMLADKHTRNVCLLSSPSDQVSRGVLAQDALAETPLWLTMMKPYLSANGHWDRKQADRNDSGRLALSPQVLICPPPLLGQHPMVTSLLDLSKVIIRPMKEGNGKRTFELGPIITMSCHQWD
ncbi:hypothetical protein O181_089342 [Austropuccinia psidii MF-1]|uniref:Uncharacterized protein n=1 Tax=Austropuccinia psidii MF-1 TaxID=1389203 RepID=A0A9Q3IT95_9BASI|nr:hypothetical protein [Austropuccinia psidii MF-1]